MITNSALTTKVVLCFLITFADGYQQYQRKIPNGESVQNPCIADHMWKGVGHATPNGGGERNPFGVAFKTDLVWDRALCEADSDGDGMTNGEELGDPNCVWQEGDDPREAAQSHPGICEPIDSKDCIIKNLGMDCNLFSCDGIAEEDTVNLTLTLDETNVPTEQNGHICQTFDIPSDKDYHLFATQPIIDNQNVIHHMFLYGCETTTTEYDTPDECHMGGGLCTTLLSYWTIGLTGDCLRSSDGILVGNSSFQKVLLQVHWYNLNMTENQKDASGMTLFLTSRLRSKNIGFLTTGTEEIRIPPATDEYSAKDTCTGYCILEDINEPIYITGVHLQMNRLGKLGKIEQYRADKLEEILYSQQDYVYDLPNTKYYKRLAQPIRLLQADELKVSCTYDSTSMSRTVSFGDEISDEKCYAHFHYYPAGGARVRCVAGEEEKVCLSKPSDKNSGISSSLNLIILLSTPLLTATRYA